MAAQVLGRHNVAEYARDWKPMSWTDSRSLNLVSDKCASESIDDSIACWSESVMGSHLKISFCSTLGEMLL